MWCPLRRMKIDHFKKIIFKIPAMGANDRQFDPELRTVFLFSANFIVFCKWGFKVLVTSLPTFHGPKCLQSYFC